MYLEEQRRSLACVYPAGTQQGDIEPQEGEAEADRLAALGLAVAVGWKAAWCPMAVPTWRSFASIAAGVATDDLAGQA